VREHGHHRGAAQNGGGVGQRQWVVQFPQRRWEGVGCLVGRLGMQVRYTRCRLGLRHRAAPTRTRAMDSRTLGASVGSARSLPS
jgi:hypothetical protein